MTSFARKRRMPSSSSPSSSPSARRTRPNSSSSSAMTAAALLLAAAGAFSSGEAFAPSPSGSVAPSSYRARDNDARAPPFRCGTPPSSSRPSRGTSTSLNFGDDGIFGVGAPEIAVTIVVGYFVLGPSDLYKLVKEIGKFIQNFRTLGTEAAKQFEGTMEDQLELTELRKAQAELSDAFSFRRSINTESGGEAFTGTSFSENTAEFAAEAVASATATATAVASAVDAEGAEGAVGGALKKKKRKLVRRRKKKPVVEVDVPSEESVLLEPPLGVSRVADREPPLGVSRVADRVADAKGGAEELPSEAAEEYPDLDMLDAPDLTDEERLRAERLGRLGGGDEGPAAPADSGEPDWFTASAEDVASEVLDRNKADPAMETFKTNRFQSQLSAEEWNSQVMANEDELAPLSMVMKRLAILEEEKNAADKILEEEYQRRLDNEGKYYLEKRRVLEEAITDIQEDVYGGMVGRTGIGEEGEKEEAGRDGGGVTEFTA